MLKGEMKIVSLLREKAYKLSRAERNHRGAGAGAGAGQNTKQSIYLPLDDFRVFATFTGIKKIEIFYEKS